MNKTLNFVAATVLMGSTVVAPMAFAQSATTPATPGTTTTAPSTAPAMPGTSAAMDTYLTQQGSDQLAASNYIGQNVYAGDKSIGEIKDLIMQQNGGLVAAVIGVGGFVGIGEKNVAVPVSKITVTRDAQNADKLRLTTTETAETLKAAPEFKTLEEQKADAGTTASTPATVTK
ncbi:PRC-barrel domain containing protein [Agrobacterium vitis]|uniref:Photosystem reaction center subunit H n=1 Tax=Agrobacterium vitis TaxID=373 RepID=A0AAE4WHT2_AGRVI|nr:PRC-barrel domain-containing protein [Agrobacterium vitis]MCF1499671.1 PRC-barrel domain containing protein [Allorhizobium sp. Av2]MCE6074917.1 photosystem reaction center subunit H [Agrobacterium vitis]MCF1469199.1 PRC-barrel domain containing protein [Agrobacterium vitis]MCM2440739.1 PRC-barrel domain containing protein [Agrobacterium vitis]MCM2450991.1 PRC-barrel domain containing protein [Agrobacterium vitis]